MVCQGLKVEIFKNSSFSPGSTKRVCVLPKCRYSDGDLTLIYFGGDECSSGFQRMSVINFECNETAGECAQGFYPCSALFGGCVLGSGGEQSDVLLWVWPPLVPTLGEECPANDTHPFAFSSTLFWEWAQHQACWDGGAVLNSGSCPRAHRSGKVGLLTNFLWVVTTSLLFYKVSR